MAAERSAQRRRPRDHDVSKKTDDRAGGRLIDRHGLLHIPRRHDAPARATTRGGPMMEARSWIFDVASQRCAPKLANRRGLDWRGPEAGSLAAGSRNVVGRPIPQLPDMLRGRQRSPLGCLPLPHPASLRRNRALRRPPPRPRPSSPQRGAARVTCQAPRGTAPGEIRLGAR